MTSGVDSQRQLTRRELRELERQAEREAAAAARAAEVSTTSAAPVKAGVDVEVAVAAAEPEFLTRRERREAERRAAEAELARLQEAARVAAVAAVRERPELFAAASEVEIAPVAVDPVPAVAARPAVAVQAVVADPIPTVAARPVGESTPVSAIPTVAVEPEPNREVEAAAAALGLPAAPVDEPKIEYAAAFVRRGQASKRSRGRRPIAANNRRAAGRFGGSMVALSFLAGTVVLGTGSAFALNVLGEPAQADERDGETPAPVDPQRLEVSADDAMSPAAARGHDATAVTSLGSAHTANLATGIKKPDSRAYVNDLTANVQWPFPTGVQMTDMYGPRVSPTFGASNWHEGVDFTPGDGTPVGAMADGKVSMVSEGGGVYGYGVFVEIEHVIEGQRVTTLYSHLQVGSVAVAEGDIVSVGDKIGAVGTTGISTGPHLHFEVRIDNRTVDPEYFLNKLNVPGVHVELPAVMPEDITEAPKEKVGIAESHDLIDRLFGS